jgi:hypothetical protein
MPKEPVTSTGEPVQQGTHCAGCGMPTVCARRGCARDADRQTTSSAFKPAPSRTPGRMEAKAAEFMRQHRQSVGYDRAALRCAYGDAAHLLDAIRADRRPMKPLRGEAARIAQAVAEALGDAAAAIFALRED